MRTSSEAGGISILRRHRPPIEGAETQLGCLQGTETQDRARSLLGLVVHGVVVRKRTAESIVSARPRATTAVRKGESEKSGSLHLTCETVQHLSCENTPARQEGRTLTWSLWWGWVLPHLNLRLLTSLEENKFVLF
nr:zinc finger protein 554 isoform X3 [Bubalus bubalis]